MLLSRPCWDRPIVAATMLLVATLGCGPAPAPASDPGERTVEPEPDEGLTEAQRAEDFDRLWTFVRDQYPFFRGKSVDWDRVREVQRPLALRAENPPAFLHVLEDTLDALHDPHCMLNANAGDSWRPVPQEVWAEWVQDRAMVTAVRAGSGAAVAGLRPGDEILAVDGDPIRARADGRISSALSEPDQAVQAWALLSAVAGRHDDPGTLEVRRADGTTGELPTRGSASGERPLVEGQRLGEVGYIRISSFGDAAAVGFVDEALDDLGDTRALILDVRSNAGGDTAVARPIMGRFIEQRTQYAWMVRREGVGLGERWSEFVEPRGQTYTAPVIVVVDRFSVSMAEGFAMGLHGMGRARIVGTRMAGLGAAIGRVELPHLGVSAQISTEPVYHVDGTPRWELEPDMVVELLAADPFIEDPILEAARTEASGVPPPPRLSPSALREPGD